MIRRACQDESVRKAFACRNARLRCVIQILGTPLRDFDPLVRGIGRLFLLQALDELVGQHGARLCRQAEKFQGNFSQIGAHGRAFGTADCLQHRCGRVSSYFLTMLTLSPFGK